MRKIILLLFMLSLIGCTEEEEDKNILSSKATIYWYLDPGFSGSGCAKVVETEKGDLYTISSSNFSFVYSKLPESARVDGDPMDNSYKFKYNVIIEYEVLKIENLEDINTYNACRHLGKWLKNPHLEYIKILDVTAIDN